MNNHKGRFAAHINKVTGHDIRDLELDHCFCHFGKAA